MCVVSWNMWYLYLPFNFTVNITILKYIFLRNVFTSLLRKFFQGQMARQQECLHIHNTTTTTTPHHTTDFNGSVNTMKSKKRKKRGNSEWKQQALNTKSPAETTIWPNSLWTHYYSLKWVRLKNSGSMQNSRSSQKSVNDLVDLQEEMGDKVWTNNESEMERYRIQSRIAYCQAIGITKYTGIFN